MPDCDENMALGGITDVTGPVQPDNDDRTEASPVVVNLMWWMNCAAAFSTD